MIMMINKGEIMEDLYEKVTQRDVAIFLAECFIPIISLFSKYIGEHRRIRVYEVKGTIFPDHYVITTNPFIYEGRRTPIYVTI
jgi:hypothetical protein